MSTGHRGVFVVLEGCDRCGKTTQCKAIVNRMLTSNLPAKYLKFPERSTGLGALINKYLTKELVLDDYEIHLLFSLNRWEFVREIEHLLECGTNLIVDRYSYSGVAYSAVKKDMDIDFCFAAELGLPEPDMVIFLDAETSLTRARQGFGDEVYEREEIQRRVREFFRRHLFRFMEVVNADRDELSITSELLNMVIERRRGVAGSELKGLNWKGSDFLKEDVLPKYKHVHDTIKEAVKILEVGNGQSEFDLEAVLQLVRSCAARVRAGQEVGGS